MIDLTPLEVRKKKGDFRKALRGYEPVLVDDFLDLVADRLEQLVRDNMAMTERLSRLEHQVADNRERERALTDALVTAQEMREEVRQQTAREADLVRRTAEQESAQVRRAAEQHAVQTKTAAEQEAAQIRAEVLKMREREEEVLRRLRARQQQLLQSYRTFLAREMAELQVIGETLEIEGMSAMDAPRMSMRAPDRDAAPPAAPAPPATAAIAPELSYAAELVHETRPEPRTDVPTDADVEPADHEPEFDAYSNDEFEAPAGIMAAIVEETEAEPDPSDSSSMRMLDEPMELDLQTDMLDHAAVMGALEVAILEDDEPFAPEPVDEWEDEEVEIEPEIGAPDHDATVLLENALKAGYRIDLDDDDEFTGADELLLDMTDMTSEELLDDADSERDSVEDEDSAEPPRGWLDKMIDDEER
jgi:DivIVA domain-containing protein